MNSAKFFTLVSFIRSAIINLLQVYKMASIDQINEGKTWYNTANEICRIWGKKYGIEPEKVAGVLSAFSINNSWDQNVLWAEKFLNAEILGIGKSIGMSIHKDYASKVIACKNIEDISEIFKNGKTFKLLSFYTNIAFANKVVKLPVKIGKKLETTLPVVTIDRHAIKACFEDYNWNKAYSQSWNYWAVSLAYYIASKRVGLLPQEFQAIVWIVIRETVENRDRHVLK